METIFDQKQREGSSVPSPLCSVGWRWSRKSRRRREKRGGQLEAANMETIFRPETDRDHQFLFQSV
jgi:hypothetical protein